MPEYIGDNEDEYDWSITWETLSRQPEEFERLSEAGLEEEAQDSAEDGQGNEESYPGAVWKAVEYLEMAAPHIKWRIKIDGDDTCGIQWDCVAVPLDQINEAEWIMERYLNEDDLSKYSPDEFINHWTVDQFPEIFMIKDGKKAFNADIQRFHDLCENLGEILESSEVDQNSPMTKEAMESVKSNLQVLLEILPQIYSLGLQLPFIYRPGEHWPGYHSYSSVYGNEEFLRLGKSDRFFYFDPPFLDGRIKEGFLSEALASIYFDSFEPALDDFQSENPTQVATAINFWQSEFKVSVDSSNAAALILIILPVLSSALREIMKVKDDSTLKSQ